MTLKAACLLFVAATSNINVNAFTPVLPAASSRRVVALKGYLDDLTNELNAPNADPDIDADSREATNYDKSKQDRYGPGSFEQYVLIEE